MTGDIPSITATVGAVVVGEPVTGVSVDGADVDVEVAGAAVVAGAVVDTAAVVGALDELEHAARASTAVTRATRRAINTVSDPRRFLIVTGGRAPAPR
jgi:hypothetical protein